MMEYYMLFAGEQYYPKMGVGDLFAQIKFGDVAEAIRFFANLNSDFDWAQVVRVCDAGIYVAAEWGIAYGGMHFSNYDLEDDEWRNEDGIIPSPDLG